MTRISFLLLLLLAAPAASAADRPSDDELFGGSDAKPAEAPNSDAAAAKPAGAKPGGTAAAPGAKASEPGLEPEAGVEKRLLGDLSRTDNPLQIGGLLYLRSNLSAREHTPPSDWTLTAPSLTDLYLDARPSNRVRGFVLGRMLFDPTLGTTTSTLPGLPATAPANPRVLLDQLWLRFDVAQTAFLTVGRQHVKWGVGRFWNPTDYLHTLRRDPLSPFDERTGTFMAKVHLPWEARGWNFYAMGIFEPLVQQGSLAYSSTAPGSQGPTQPTSTGTGSRLGDLGGGARAEIVLGSWELGLDAVAQRGIKPRFGIDLSGGIWELDVRGELALRTSSDVPLYQTTPSGPAVYDPSGVRPMLVLGADWSHKYSDEDTFTVGVEYFHDSNGYPDAALYPLLIAANAFTPFYLGRHYAGAYLQLPQPGSWNLQTFTLSAIANLSDRSGIARLDWSMTLLTYLTLEAYAQGHFGTSGGEFRLAFDVPANFFATGSPGVHLDAPVMDVGLALRMSL